MGYGQDERGSLFKGGVEVVRWNARVISFYSSKLERGPSEPGTRGLASGSEAGRLVTHKCPFHCAHVSRAGLIITIALILCSYFV
ncbi:hypothetical protein CROQUDRAFT_663677 [Cronartium quercuum f. sp. fusiforme G11]|uniref:Uncharacterized protein n=1 Tax=Cronartium quercuum f. sp. fusiforme G11 TaxID=708437 RepID=A0A9P6N9K5_9BASI|nr:hypothetical protein CROQUDRAFT_663677 [Cronartium quercuum f. sp. fusiforme G11]